MIQTKLFRRHYAITALIVFAFLVAGFFVQNAAMRLVANHHAFEGNLGPELFIAKLIDQDTSPSGNRVATLSRLQELGVNTFPMRFHILAEDGRNLSDDERLPLPWDRIEKPVLPYQFTKIEDEHGGDGTPEGRHRGPPRPPNSLIRLQGEPARYLYASRDESRGPPHGPPSFYFFVTTIGSLVLSILLGVGFALYLLFRSMREKMLLADNVIAELQRGNLKARFPIKRRDELGQMMARFNRMADEIERLVEHLHSIEKSRVTLLQDLAHDLRTPIASMKNLLVTIDKRSQPSDIEVRKELLSLSRREVEYFERLVEDLLVLAQMSDPSYQGDRRSVSLAQILDEEVDGITAQDSGKTIEIIDGPAQAGFEVLGDGHLLRRLFRNALDNAYSFAKSRVAVKFLESDPDALTILIQDDGPGLSDEALKKYGERRISRVVEKTQGNRLSVGLGSVIMKTVAELHRGSLSARNNRGASDGLTGAEIRITLPRARKGAIST